MLKRKNINFISYMFSEMKQPDPELLKLILDHAPIGIFTLELIDRKEKEFRLVHVNEMNSKIVGLDLKQFLGMTLREAFPAAYENGAVLPNAYLKALETGQIVHIGEMEYGDQKIDRQTFMLSCKAISGSLVVLFTENATQIKSTLLQLKEANRRQEQINRLSPDIIYVFDLQRKKTVYSNRKLLTELGYDQEVMQFQESQFLADNIHPEDLPKILNHFENILPRLKDNETVKIEYRIMHQKTRHYLWIKTHETVFERDPTGAVIRIIGVARNISHEKKTELAALQRINEELSHQKQLLDSGEHYAKAGTLIWNSKTNHTDYSIGALEIFDFRPEEVNKENFLKKVLERSHPDDLKQMQAFVKNVRQSQEPFIEECRIIIPDGTMKWVRISALPGVKTNVFITIIQDISIEKEAQQAQEQINVELEQFIYSMAHDLRAPVRHIEGYADILREEESTQLSKQGKQMLSRVIYSAKRLGNMIDELLQYARNRNLIPQKEQLNFNKIVKQLVQEFNSANPDRDLQWEVANLHRIYADKTMIQLVMQNILSNAVKYSSKEKRGLIQIWTEEKDHVILTVVKDNGCGFDMRHSNKLFTPFQRLHPQRQFPGYGIGLANVHRIISQHQGHIWAEGIVGEGATFYFTLPKKMRGKRG